ncbi:MAG: phosphoribosylanthranilate isomerase [Pseudomonadota bacterium]
MDIAVKICGLTRLADLRAAAGAGARYVGFVFFDRSPRNITPENARALALECPAGLTRVGLVVDPSDRALDALLNVVPLDMLQLHGAETPERVAEVRTRTSLPVMKAIGIGDRSDIDRAADYADTADQLLLDAKPPQGAERPGGNAVRFDWRLVADKRWPVPWMLAGGLTPENVRQAVAQTGARQVDVSSGVESAPGIKDAAKIAAFLGALDSAPTV